MNGQTSRLTDRFRRPEYTGENRCTPCTVLNVVVAAVAAGAVALWSVPAAVALAAASLAVIYLRGYLVPGTPTITSRYVPDRVLAWFDKAGADAPDGAVEADGAVGADGDVAPAGGDDIGGLLLSAGVVGDCEDEDDLCLDPEFEAVWWRRIRQLQDEVRARDRLASILEVDPDALSLDDGGDGFDVTFEGDRIGGWRSRAAFMSDLAVEPTLAEWLPEWEALGDRERTELLASMRVFLEECPDCESALEPVEDVRKTCCSGEVVNVTIECDACGATVFNGSYR